MKFKQPTQPSSQNKPHSLTIKQQRHFGQGSTSQNIFRRLGRVFQTTIAFGVLVIGFSIANFLKTLFPVNKKWSKPFLFLPRAFDRLYGKIIKTFDKGKEETASRSYLIELSFRNMQAKRTRTVVTICGMAISIAFIVLLMSVGYGLQDLVTSRVARLEELQQTEVMPGLSDELSLNDEVVARLKNMPDVKSVLPLISVVGRISYQDSIADLAVYGTTTEYLTSSAIQPTTGKVFESYDTSRVVGEKVVFTNLDDSADASAPPRVGQEVRQTNFSISEKTWLRVRSGPSTQDVIVGYTKKTADIQSGTFTYGDHYIGYEGDEATDEEGELLALWIKSEFSLWENKTCSISQSEEEGSAIIIDPQCEDGQYLPLRDSSGQQMTQGGYIAQLPDQVAEVSGSEDVLGVKTVLAQESEMNALPLVGEATASGMVVEQQTTVVKVAAGSLRQAVVNKAVLTLLGLTEDNAVGQSITLTFVAVGDLIEGEAERIESAPTSYEIVGVTPEEDTPVVYVPLTELRSLGLNRFSQLKVIADHKNDLPKVRASVEAMGYGTVSVADTVAQIDNLFGTVRLLFGIVGLVGLVVASLGMFNTLTVSLLERTREVGLLKAMGMKSNEVRELFLTESMIMGFYGGVIGLLLGAGAGKLISLALSSIAVAKGVGFIDVSVVPFNFVLVVLSLALVVGIITGYFPARRATKISALNALRYE